MTRKRRIEREKQAMAEVFGHIGTCRQELSIALGKTLIARNYQAEALINVALDALAYVYGDSSPERREP